MPSLATITDAVRDSLNGATFSRAFVARRVYDPDVAHQDLDGLTVHVCGNGTFGDSIARAISEDDITVETIFRQQVPVVEGRVDVAEVDSLIDLVCEIRRHLRRRQMDGAPWIRTEGRLYVAEYLRQSPHVFMAYLQTTYRVETEE